MAIALLLPEGLAVGALVHGGVALVGADQNPVQRAVVAAAAMVGALGDGAFDALVAVAVHNLTFFSWDGISMAPFPPIIQRFSPIIFFGRIDKREEALYNSKWKSVSFPGIITKGGTPALKRKEFCHDL